MAKEKEELFITEISEEDFRKLNLVAYAKAKKTSGNITRVVWEECDLNKVLDAEIKWAIEGGYEDGLDTLKTPVTIAIHRDNGPDPDDYYLDKFTNLLGPSTYLVATRIHHLYSTRDYFEDREDYFRIPKNETKSIYRVHLDARWQDQFVLKHKTVVLEQQDETHWIEGNYVLDPDTKEWKLKTKVQVVAEGYCTSTQYIPLDESEKSE